MWSRTANGCFGSLVLSATIGSPRWPFSRAASATGHFRSEQCSSGSCGKSGPCLRRAMHHFLALEASGLSKVFVVVFTLSMTRLLMRTLSRSAGSLEGQQHIFHFHLALRFSSRRSCGQLPYGCSS